MSPLRAAMTGATTASFSSATGIPNLALSVRAPANTINRRCNGAGGKTRQVARSPHDHCPSFAVRPNFRFAQKADLSGSRPVHVGDRCTFSISREYKSGVRARANRCSERLVFQSPLQVQDVSLHPNDVNFFASREYKKRSPCRGKQGLLFKSRFLRGALRGAALGTLLAM